MGRAANTGQQAKVGGCTSPNQQQVPEPPIHTAWQQRGGPRCGRTGWHTRACTRAWGEKGGGLGNVMSWG